MTVFHVGSADSCSRLTVIEPGFKVTSRHFHPYCLNVLCQYLIECDSLVDQLSSNDSVFPPCYCMLVCG